MARKNLWCDVGLQVESRDLCRESLVVDSGEDLQRQRRRAHVAIDQEYFLFGPNPADSAFDLVVLDQVIECAQVIKQSAHERLNLEFVAVLFDSMSSHDFVVRSSASFRGTQQRSGEFRLAMSNSCSCVCAGHKTPMLSRERFGLRKSSCP